MTIAALTKYTVDEVITISYLSDLLPGKAAFIYNISEGPLKERLCDLGFIVGTRVECVAAAPLGGPSAYLIRGSVIALRREDARTIGIGHIPSDLPITLKHAGIPAEDS